MRTLFHRKVNPKIEQLDSYRIELSLIERDSCSFQLTGEPPRRAFEMLRSDVGRERERNVEGAIKRKLFVPAVKITSRFSRNPVLYAKQSLYDSWFTVVYRLKQFRYYSTPFDLRLDRGRFFRARTWKISPIESRKFRRNRVWLEIKRSH